MILPQPRSTLFPYTTLFRSNTRTRSRNVVSNGFLAKYPLRINVDNRRSTSKRSEEHTSELQSRGHLVCRLLLEKKKLIEAAVAGLKKMLLSHSLIILTTIK